MRQVGVVATAGLVALDTMIERLAHDHRHARLIAEHLAAVPGVVLDLASVQTNIVVFEPPEPWTPDCYLKSAREAGVWLVPFGGRRLRAITHADVNREASEIAAERLVRVLKTVEPRAAT